MSVASALGTTLFKYLQDRILIRRLLSELKPLIPALLAPLLSIFIRPGLPLRPIALVRNAL